MEDYIELDQLDYHIRTEKKKKAYDKDISKFKSIFQSMGKVVMAILLFLWSMLKATGRFCMNMAEKMEANKKAQVSNSPTPQKGIHRPAVKVHHISQETPQKSYMMGIAENFAHGSFSSNSNLHSIDPYHDNRQRRY